MKILVSGASGFIGTNLMLSLKDKFEVIGIDKEEPKTASLNPYWRKVDIIDKLALKNIVTEFDPDYVVHLAARTDLEGNTLDDYAANIVGVQNLMEVVQELKNLKKIVITSSMLVCHTGYFPKDQFDYAPTTLYGESKVETERIVWANKPQCDWAIIRPTSIWGPWFGVPYRNFFDMVINKRYFHIGRRSCTKTYGYVGNAVYQIEQILFNDTSDERQKVFYIGDYSPVNIEEWANEIAGELRYKVRRMPYGLLKIGAWVGDFLKELGITFPMTSFRLKNMTSNNVVDLSATHQIVPNLPYSRLEGVKKTLYWLNENRCN